MASPAKSSPFRATSAMAEPERHKDAICLGEMAYLVKVACSSAFSSGKSLVMALRITRGASIITCHSNSRRRHHDRPFATEHILSEHFNGPIALFRPGESFQSPIIADIDEGPAAPFHAAKLA